MLARFFRSANPQIFVALLVSMIILRLSGLFDGVVVVEEFEAFPWLGWLLALVLLAFSAWQLNRVIEKHDMFKPLNYLVGLNLIVLSSAHPELLNFRLEYLALPFVIATLDVCLNLPKTNKVLASIYNGGFYVGVATLIIPASLAVLLPLYIGVIVFRAPQWRNYLMPLLGMSTPWLLWGTWRYWSDASLDFQFFGWVEAFSHGPSMGAMEWASVALVVLAVPLFLRFMSSNTIRGRRGLTVVIMTALVFILPYLFTKDNSGFLPLLGVGVAPVTAYFQLHARKNWMREAHLILLILWALVGQFEIWS